MSRPLSLAAYGLAMAALEPLAPAILARRAARGKEHAGRLMERLGRPVIARPIGALVWLHGASVGETLSLLPLIERLSQARPDLTLLVTSGTLTSAALLAQRLPQGAIHQFAPLDTPAIARRFLDHWRPSLAIFVESELWPSLLLEARRRGVRLALLGARLSDASARGWGRVPRAARHILGAFDLVLAQDGLSHGRLEALGASPHGLLDLKASAAPLPYAEDEHRALAAEIAGRGVLTAASTHPGEDEIIAEAFGAAPGANPLLILAPRHPERGGAVAEAMADRGLTVARRSLAEPVTAETQVYLADTLGELGLLFRVSDAVVMGGSLTGGIGGHNPLEPARLGLPIITGPDIANFREAYAGLVAAEAALTVEPGGPLAEAIAGLLADPGGARAMGQRAKAFAATGDQVLNAAMAALEPLLPPQAAP